MDLEQFRELIAEIMSLSYDRETAGRYAGLIGDTPAIDAEGNVVVMEPDGREIARLKLKFFDD